MQLAEVKNLGHEITRDALLVAAKELAAEMDGWEAVAIDSYWQFQLSDGEGRLLLFNTTHKPGKLSISGSWPLTKDRNTCSPDNTPKITVSASRTAADIARDIERRFLPDYLELHAKMIILRDKENASSDAQAVRVKALGELLEEEASEQNIKNAYFRLYKWGITDVRISSDTMRIELGYLPHNVAEKVIKLLKKEMPEDD